MQLYPAIDIKNGHCVRLRQGQFHESQTYSSSPLSIAKQWERMGATFIHIVDLDGALAGYSVNEEVIREITENVAIPVQVGGGIRTMKDIESKLDLGVSRVIIGTKAVEDPLFVKEAVLSFGADAVAVGIDAKDGFVAVQGWEKLSTSNAVEMALEMKNLGVKTIVYTDISKDGMLMGPNIENTKNMIDVTGLDVIASGGITSIKDLEMIKYINAAGAIIGKALYENKIDLEKAINLFER